MSEKVRDALKRRARGRCERCGQVTFTADPHHRLQRSLGGQDTLSNLVRVCRSCHDHIHDEHDFTDGYLLHSWEDPLKIPVLMFDGLTLLDDDGTLLAT